jgi:hypothetical protein
MGDGAASNTELQGSLGGIISQAWCTAEGRMHGRGMHCSLPGERTGGTDVAEGTGGEGKLGVAG